jgi:uncharacterized protein (DUF2384 family)
MIVESNSAANLVQIRALALHAFGSEPVAESWLNQYHALLGGAPIVMAKSSSGFAEVQNILSAINYGGAV